MLSLPAVELEAFLAPKLVLALQSGAFLRPGCVDCHLLVLKAPSLLSEGSKHSLRHSPAGVPFTHHQRLAQQV
jgi:hypothetical protein